MFSFVRGRQALLLLSNLRPALLQHRHLPRDRLQTLEKSNWQSDRSSEEDHKTGGELLKLLNDFIYTILFSYLNNFHLIFILPPLVPLYIIMKDTHDLLAKTKKLQFFNFHILFPLPLNFCPCQLSTQKSLDASIYVNHPQSPPSHL